MSPSRLFDVALDVLREAFARKLMVGLFIFITMGLLLLLFALDLEVVEGTLAAGRLFGFEFKNPIIPIDIAMSSIFSLLAYVFFYVGMLFGVVATAGIAADMLAPGRVEFLLSLPVRRTELVVGTYLGVLSIVFLASATAVGGSTLILWAKTGFFTLAPLWSAVSSMVAFMAVYGLMLLVTSLMRSMVLAAGSGLVLFLAGIITSSRDGFLDLMNPGAVRTVLDILIAPLPRFHRLAQAGADAANDLGFWQPGTGMVVFGALMFALFCVTAATFVVQGRDY